MEKQKMIKKKWLLYIGQENKIEVNHEEEKIPNI